MRSAAVAVVIGGPLLTGCLFAPTPECPEPGPIRCEIAATLAVANLAPDHQPITRVQFLYGSARAHRTPLSVVELIESYVVFTYDDGSRQFVEVVLWPDGFLSTGTPMEY